MQSARRIGVFVYGTACYVMFLGVFLYLFAFVGGFGLHRTVDGPVTTRPFTAVLINLGLLLAFGLQHTVMARPGFKAMWTRIVPEPIERSTYVLLTNLVFMVLFWQWRPIAGAAWDFHHPAARGALLGLFGLGWLLVFVATVQLNHFDLFGLRQVWLYLRGREYTRLVFATPALYMQVRHPLYVGWITAFWATPTMTVGHLLFAVVMTGYILIAIRFEERDLIAFHGPSYVDYRRRVPMLIPAVGRLFGQARPPETI